MEAVAALANAVVVKKADVTLKYKGKDYDAKSIMMLFSACIMSGSEVEVICDGPDEEEAMREVENVFENL